MIHTFIAVGLGIFVTLLIIVLVKFLPEISAAIDRQIMQRISKSSRKRNIRKTQGITPEDKVGLISAAILGLLLAGIGRDPKESMTLLAVGALVGLFGVKGLYKIKKDMGREKRLADILALFEGIELYIRVGYSLIQALKGSMLLVPSLKVPLNKLINNWSSGPRAALEAFGRDLDVPEADILVALLIQIEIAGNTELSEALEKEAVNIERLKEARNEAKIANRPMYLMFYRMLPLGAALLLVAGPLMYRTYAVMVDAGISPF